MDLILVGVDMCAQDDVVPFVPFNGIRVDDAPALIVRVLTGCLANGPIFEEDEPRVQNFRIDKFEARLWIASIDGLPTSAAKD
jgi:hypothetical protein